MGAYVFRIEVQIIVKNLLFYFMKAARESEVKVKVKVSRYRPVQALGVPGD
jgi:hypothetical protein